MVMSMRELDMFYARCITNKDLKWLSINGDARQKDTVPS